jgi:phosphoribosylamine--glycine ligase
MRILVLGSGAREHAIIKTFKKDPQVTKIFAAPGNAGIAADVETFALDINNPKEVSASAVLHEIDFVVIGPEQPLVNGVADAIRARGIACFGPSMQAAQLESSKSFAKEIMQSAKVPTANSITCNSLEEVEKALQDFGSPYVIKNDGLASGKGVVVTNVLTEAINHAKNCLENNNSKVVVEEYLTGPEVSLLCVADGNNVIALSPAQDYKRVGDNDTGLNTGGMGAYSPIPWLDPDFVTQTIDLVAKPILEEMGKRLIPFSGILYIGLILTPQGTKVIEFNVRFGDPETQVILSRLKTPLLKILYASAVGNLSEIVEISWSDKYCVTVVLAAKNYPNNPEIGQEITGLSDAQSIEGVEIFHAGTIERDGKIVSDGGRVLSVTALGQDLSQARELVYQALKKIQLSGSHYRSDIALMKE